MTLNANLLDERSGTAAVTDADPDSDAGLFSMSPASAEQITVQISTMFDRGWEYLALAYKGRAFIALGYSSWNHEATGKTLGRDGKEYPRRRRIPVTSCTLCGDIHPDDPEECPWDRYAQGIGPHPDIGDTDLDDENEVSPPEQRVADVDRGDVPERRPAANDFRPPRPRAKPNGGSNLPIQAIEAMESIADQAATLPDLLTDIERSIESDEIVGQSDLLSLRLR